MRGVNEQPRRAAKGLPCVGWDRGGTLGTLDGEVFRPSKYGLVPRVPDEEESELMAVQSFFGLEPPLAVGRTRAGQGEMSKG